MFQHEMHEVIQSIKSVVSSSEILFATTLICFFNKRRKSRCLLPHLELEK